MFFTRFTDALRLGASGLAAHRLRSGLSALGIVLGVGSVIVMLAIGEAARYQALKQLEDLGANTILLRSRKPAEEPAQKQGVDLLAYGLTYKDVERIQATIPTVTAAIPMREAGSQPAHGDGRWCGGRAPDRRRHPVVDRSVSSAQGRGRHRPARSAAKSRKDPTAFHPDPGRDRRHLPGGRRHRHHEHHAG